MLEACTGTERILRTPCPPGYVGVLRAVIVIWLSLLPICLCSVAGGAIVIVPVTSIIRRACFSGSGQSWARSPRPFVMSSFAAPAAFRSSQLTPMMRCACSFMVLAVEEIAVEMENPFGFETNDLPLDSLCLTIQAAPALSPPPLVQVRGDPTP